MSELDAACAQDAARVERQSASGDKTPGPARDGGRVLSGGERARLKIARMLLRPGNVLVMDEPTNHLDLHSQGVLLEALQRFGGTVIFVSHDRVFVRELATAVLHIADGRVGFYPCDYEQFRWKQSQEA